MKQKNNKISWNKKEKLSLFEKILNLKLSIYLCICIKRPNFYHARLELKIPRDTSNPLFLNVKLTHIFSFKPSENIPLKQMA